MLKFESRLLAIYFRLRVNENKTDARGKRVVEADLKNSTSEASQSFCDSFSLKNISAQKHNKYFRNNTAKISKFELVQAHLAHKAIKDSVIR